MTRPSAVMAAMVAVSLALAGPAGAAEPPATETPTSPEPAAPAPPGEVTSGEPAPTSAPTSKPEEELSEADTLVVRAGLDIDTSEAGPAGPVIVSRIEELGNLELRRAEILPSRLGNDPVIRIRVALQGEAADAFVIHSEVTVRGEIVEGSARDVACGLCTEGEVVERARGEIFRLVPFVRARFQAAPPKVEPPKQPEPPKTDPRALTGLGKAGIGLLAVGTLAFATGLGLALNKPRPDPEMPLNEITTRPAGYGVLAVGAAALITGTVLLVLDRKRARRTVQLAPLGTPGTTGLMLVGRF